MKFGLEVRKFQNDIYFVKVIKMMEVDDMIRVANSIAIMAFTYFAIKLVIIPAWNYVF